MRLPTRNDRSRPWMDATYPNRNQIEGVVDYWGDLMATCYAHLRSALSVIEELSRQSEAASGDLYCYDQASGCVWIALVALAQCGSDASSPERN
jgi:hypothetical protein